MENKEKSFSELLEESRVCQLLQEFAASFDLYSVVMDMKGGIIGQPTGPASYFGEFYEMVRNPDNMGLFEDVKASIRSEEGPVYMEIRDENPDNRLSAAPLYLKGIYSATWLLYAHTRQQNQKLFHIHENQGRIAAILSEYLTSRSGETAGGEEAELLKKKLAFMDEEKRIMLELQDLSADKKEIFNRLTPAANLLDVDYIIYYVKDKKRPQYMLLEDYWCRTGKSQEAEKVFSWDHDHYSQDIQRKIREEGLIVDQRNMTNQMRVEVFDGNARAVMVFSVIQKSQYVGRIIFLETKKERVWTEEEVNFARLLTRLLSKKLKRQKSQKGKADIGAFDVFDLVEYPIFARDNSTGEVFFSNRAMNLAIGEDFTEKNSFDMIPPAVEGFEGYRDAESAPDHADEKQVTSRFRRYVSELSGIYNVTEHRMKWKDKKPASLFILQEVKEESGGY